MKKPVKLLVIDDDAISRQILVTAVEDLGLVAIQSGNGSHGWETLAENTDIRLVITDMMMPDMDGLTLSQIIRGNKTVSSVPIVIVSGVIDAGEAAKVLSLGNCYFFPKPIDILGLKDSVQRLLAAEP